MGVIRDRKSIVCGFCKKRKIRCNKQTPCSSCVRYKNVPCEYDYPSNDITSSDSVRDGPGLGATNTSGTSQQISEAFTFPHYPPESLYLLDPENGSFDTAGPFISSSQTPYLGYDSNFVMPMAMSVANVSMSNVSVSNPMSNVSNPMSNVSNPMSNVSNPMTNDSNPMTTTNRSPESGPSTIDQDSSGSYDNWPVSYDSDQSNQNDSSDQNDSISNEFEVHPAVLQSLKLASYNTIGRFATLKLNWFQQYEFVEKPSVTFDESVQNLSFVGPFSWKGAMKVDLFVRYLYVYGSGNIPAQYNTFLLNVDRTYKLGYTYLMKFRYENMKNCPRTGRFTSGTSTGNGTRSSSISSSDSIKNLLIPSSQAGAILNHFFSEIYPFVPILDQTSFTQNITRILTNQTSSTFICESSDDYIYASMLLLIIKLVEVDKIVKSGEDFDLDLGSSFESEPLVIAKKCVQQLLANDSVNILLLQLIILLRFFHSYGLHMGDSLDNGRGDIYTAITYKVCKRLGLNQDPDMNPFLNENDKHLLRKMWYTLRSMNGSDFATMSTPILNHLGHSVAVPEAKYANVEDPHLEKVCCSVFENAQIYDFIYSKISEMALSSVKTFKLTRMTGLVNEFRIVLEKDLARDLTVTGEIWISVGFQKYLNMYGVLLSTLMNFNSYCCNRLDYERGTRLSLIISKLIHFKLLPLISFYLSNNNFKLVKGSFTVLPLVNSVLSLVMVFYVSMIIKIKLILSVLQPSENSIENLYFRNLVVFQDLVYKSCGLVLNNYMGKLSRYYYTSWHAKHTYRYYLELVEQSQVFKPIFESQLDKEIFERTGLKNSDNITELHNTIYGTVSELAYKWEFPGENGDFANQFGDSLRQACGDDRILNEIGDTKQPFMGKCVEREFNKVDVKELTAVFA